MQTLQPKQSRTAIDIDLGDVITAPLVPTGRKHVRQALEAAAATGRRYHPITGLTEPNCQILTYPTVAETSDRKVPTIRIDGLTRLAEI